MAMGTALMLPEWLALTDAKRRNQFEQLIRYFVSPLLQISEIRPYQYRFKNVQFKTYQAFVNGIDFVFIPGMPTFTTGLNKGEIRRVQESLSQQIGFDPEAVVSWETVRIPPMLVAKNPISLTQQVKGVLEIMTGQFYGDAFFKKRRQKDIDQVLRSLKRPKDMDPMSFDLPDHFETSVGKTRLLPDLSYYQFSLNRINLDYPTLITELSRQGMTLADRYAYLYLRTYQQQTFFPWGTTYLKDEATLDVENYFGLNYCAKPKQGEVLLDHQVVGAISTDVTDWANFSPYYQSGVVSDQLPAAEVYYRPVINIVFPD